MTKAPTPDTFPAVLTNTSQANYFGFVEVVVPRLFGLSSGESLRWEQTGGALQGKASMGVPVGAGGRVAVLVNLPPVSELRMAVRRIKPTDAIPGPTVTDATVPPPPPALPPVVLEVPYPRVGVIGQGEVTWLDDRTTQEGVVAVRSMLGRAGPFVVTLICWRAADEPWTRFELSTVFSEPRIPDLQADHLGVTLGHGSMYVHVDVPALEPAATPLTVGGWARNVYPPATLGNGQGHAAVRGALLDYKNPRTPRDLESMVAIQQDDPSGCAYWSGNFGPFGKLPALAPQLGDGKLAAESFYRRWLSATKPPPSQWGTNVMNLGLLGAPGSTGDQEEFGIVKGAEAASPIVPAPFNLRPLRQCALEEYRRPIHYHEADGKLVRAAAHPNWHTWAESTHFHPSQSPDRLGKPEWWGPFESHGFWGRDNQHSSMLRLCSIAQLDGSRIVLRELESHVEAFLCHVFDSASRARGRHLHSACWLYLLTRRDDLMQKIVQTIQLNEDTWATQPHWQVTVSSWAYPDGRVLGGRSPWWSGWAESLAVPGLFAAWKLTGDPVALDLAKRSAFAVVRFAWFKRAGSALWRLGSGITYRGFTVDAFGNLVPDGTEGLPLSQADYEDPTKVEDAGGDFPLWGYAAVAIAHQLSNGLAGAEDVYAKSGEILNQIKAGRDPATTFARFDDWTALDA